MYTITIVSKNGERKVIHPGPTFGTDVKGNRLSPSDVQAIANDIGWDTFGRNCAVVTCVKPKFKQ